MNRYDIIGDIHGYAEPLKELLTRLGYEERDGCYRHGTRQVIFLGDFIDRGPQIAETLRIVRAMVKSGTALAVMGNHEYNAICFHTPDGRGGHLRSHTAKGGQNVVQHQATLTQFADRPDEWAGHLAWFKTLPMFLDLDGLRIVHACWDKAQIEVLGGNPILSDVLLFKPVGSAEANAIDVLLKGKELPLPDGKTFSDKEGHVRKEIRVKWWLGSAGQTYRSLCLPASPDAPNLAIAAEHHSALGEGYGRSEPPVFIGHYWLPPLQPQPLAPNIACVDYSVAKAGGMLVAYSWDGEREIDGRKFRCVSRGAPTARA